MVYWHKVIIKSCFYILFRVSYWTHWGHSDANRSNLISDIIYLVMFIKIRFINFINPLSANSTKWSNTLKQFVGNLPTNWLSVFDNFVELVLKELRQKNNSLGFVLRELSWLLFDRVGSGLYFSEFLFLWEKFAKLRIHMGS